MRILINGIVYDSTKVPVLIEFDENERGYFNGMERYVSAPKESTYDERLALSKVDFDDFDEFGMPRKIKNIGRTARLDYLEREIKKIHGFIYNSKVQPQKEVFDNLKKLENEYPELKLASKYGLIGEFGVPKNI